MIVGKLIIMNKLNLPPFYIGQKVEYIKNNSFEKGSKHIITNIWKNKGCNCWFVWVEQFNNKFSPPGYYYCVGCNGNIDSPNSTLEHGILSKSFRAVEEIKASIMTLSQIKETEREEILLNN